MENIKNKIQSVLVCNCVSFEHARELFARYNQLENITHACNDWKEDLKALRRSHELIRNEKAQACIQAAIQETENGIHDFESHFRDIKERIEHILSEYA